MVSLYKPSISDYNIYKMRSIDIFHVALTELCTVPFYICREFFIIQKYDHGVFDIKY